MLALRSVSRALGSLVSLVALSGCGSDPVTADEPWTPSPEAAATAGVIGRGDGSSGSVRFEVVLDPSDSGDAELQPTGLAWHGLNSGELWVVLRFGPDPRTCNDGEGPCEWLAGHVALVSGADTASPSVQMKVDANSWHFMRRPSGLAWGAGELFATCSEARTGNYEDDAAPYIGPTLWTSDPAIFAVRPGPGENGTHLDMLHNTPFCMGIAHEVDNVYWLFNGDAGSLDRYDFHEPHQPGGEDHADGEFWRFAAGELLRLPEVPAGMVYDAASGLLYASDAGHSRVVVLDTASGAITGEIMSWDNLRTRALVTGARLSDAVPAGDVPQPSGLALVGGVLFVADRFSGVITAYDVAARRPIRSLDTGLGAGALTALSYGPDGKLYFSDVQGGRVLRIEPN